MLKVGVQSPLPASLRLPRSWDITRSLTASCGRRVHEDLTRPGGALQAGRHVDAVAHDRVVHAPLGADVAGQHLPAGDADTRLQSNARHRRDVEERNPGLQIQCGAYGSFRIV